MVKPILVSIEGNIGSGKSTRLQELRAAYPSWHFIDEPVSEWFNYKDGDKTILELFYSDKNRYGYTFQTMAFITRVINISKTIKAWEEECKSNPDAAHNNVFVTERCIETDYNVFAKMLFDDGFLTQLEMDLYMTWFNHLRDKCSVDAIVYIKTVPTTCSERISVRSRDGEDGIPLEYLESLEKYHTVWLDNIDVPILNFDNNGTGTDNKLDDIYNFVTSIQS